MPKKHIKSSYLELKNQENPSIIEFWDTKLHQISILENFLLNCRGKSYYSKDDNNVITEVEVIPNDDLISLYNFVLTEKTNIASSLFSNTTTSGQIENDRIYQLILTSKKKKLTINAFKNKCHEGNKLKNVYSSFDWKTIKEIYTKSKKLNEEQTKELFKAYWKPKEWIPIIQKLKQEKVLPIEIGLNKQSNYNQIICSIVERLKSYEENLKLRQEYLKELEQIAKESKEELEKTEVNLFLEFVKECSLINFGITRKFAKCLIKHNFDKPIKSCMKVGLEILRQDKYQSIWLNSSKLAFWYINEQKYLNAKNKIACPYKKISEKSPCRIPFGLTGRGEKFNFYQESNKLFIEINNLGKFELLDSQYFQNLSIIKNENKFILRFKRSKNSDFIEGELKEIILTKHKGKFKFQIPISFDYPKLKYKNVGKYFGTNLSENPKGINESEFYGLKATSFDMNISPILGVAITSFDELPLDCFNRKIGNGYLNLLNSFTLCERNVLFSRKISNTRKKIRFLKGLSNLCKVIYKVIGNDIDKIFVNGELKIVDFIASCDEIDDFYTEKYKKWILVSGFEKLIIQQILDRQNKGITNLNKSIYNSLSTIMSSIKDEINQFQIEFDKQNNKLCPEQYDMLFCIDEYIGLHKNIQSWINQDKIKSKECCKNLYEYYNNLRKDLTNKIISLMIQTTLESNSHIMLIEKLDMKNDDKYLNKLNKIWSIKSVINQLKEQSRFYGIEVFEVNPMHTSQLDFRNLEFGYRSKYDKRKLYCYNKKTNKIEVIDPDQSSPIVIAIRFFSRNERITRVWAKKVKNEEVFVIQNKDKKYLTSFLERNYGKGKYLIIDGQEIKVSKNKFDLEKGFFKFYNHNGLWLSEEVHRSFLKEYQNQALEVGFEKINISKFCWKKDLKLN